MRYNKIFDTIQSKKFLTLVLTGIFMLLFTLQDAEAQRWKRERHHFIFGVGATGFMGELGGADDIGTQGIRDFNFEAVRPSFMGGYRYKIYPDIAIAGTLSIGYISGDDKNTSEIFRNNRNINFRSPVIELAAKGQYYFLKINERGSRYRRFAGRGRSSFSLSAYAFAGLAGFYFNPQGYFDSSNYAGSISAEDLPADGWYNLRPLRTEGQGYYDTRESYLPISVSIPFGLGALIHLTRNISIGIEYGYRKTFTDYIDDVSKTYVNPDIYSEIFMEEPARIALAEYFSNPTNNTLQKSVTAPGQQRGNPFNTDTYMFSFVTIYYKMPDMRRPASAPRF